MNASLFPDVPDPTDFPPSTETPGLRQLDRAFRCNICQEFYDAPVMLPCGHTFCSVCARDHFAHHQECPTCRASASVQKLTTNVAMEDVVGAWKASRDTVLCLARELAAKKPRPESKSPCIPISRANALKKRKWYEEPTSRPEAGPSKVAKVKEQVVLDLSDDTEDELSQEEEPPRTSRAGSRALDAHALVDCPMCGKSMPQELIWNHTESKCKTLMLRPDPAKKKKVKDEWHAMFNQTEASKKNNASEKAVHAKSTGEKLASVSYNLFNDRQLKQKLRELGLPTTGDRTILMKRHERYTVLFNANLDRSVGLRKSIASLRDELREWEKTMAILKTKVHDEKAYTRDNKATFDRLIAEVRQNRLKGHETPMNTDILSASNTDNAKHKGPSSGLSNSPSSSSIPIPASSWDVITLESDEEP